MSAAMSAIIKTILDKPFTDLEFHQIRGGIKECERFIELESKRSADLRPASVTQHLEFCKRHKIKLQQVLDTGDRSLLKQPS